MQGSSFVADAIHLLESQKFKFVSSDLDDEAMVFSFSFGPSLNFSVLGGDYPQETLVLGGSSEQTFRSVSLGNIVASLCAPPAAAVVEASRLERDLQHVLKTQFSQLADLKRSGDSGLSFKLHGKPYEINSGPDYPKNSVVTVQGDMSCIDMPLIQYLEKLDAKPAPTKKQRHSSESESASEGEDDEENDDDGDDEEVPLQSSGEQFNSEDLAHFSVVAHCKPLERDKEAVASVFDDESVFVINQVDDVVNLGLNLNVNFLSSRVATAWGVLQGIPIRIALRDLSASLYCNGPPPSVKIMQMLDGEALRHGVLPQLEYIAQTFIKEEWNKFRARGNTYYQDALSSGGGNNNNNNLSNSGGKHGAKMELDIGTLIAMGFKRKNAEEALVASKGDVQAAVELLSSSKKGWFGKEKKPPTLAVAIGSRGGIEQSVEEAERKKNAFRLRPEFGILVGLLDYLTYRLGSLNEFCPLCDCGHMFGAPMLKPAVCRRELCAFAFSKLGLLSDTVDGVAMQAEVVDLLVSMCRAAAASTRAATVLDPCPLIFDPKDPNKPVISDVTQHLPLINAALSGIKISTMMEVARSRVPDVHPLSYPLLQWIVSSNRSHLVKLSPEKFLPCMGTKFQFLLLSAPPEVEEAFKVAKAKSGSVWAFHGSRTENWHAILRNGLKNMSGTKGQLNGAAYGPGVYVSPTASMSLGYSGMHYMAPRAAGAVAQENEFLEGAFFCMAIVEIIAGAEKRHNASVWTIVDDTKVVTRFFMVWPPGHSTSVAQTAISTSDEFIKQVENAMIGFD